MHPLEERGAELLGELAADPDSERAQQFDAHYYEMVWKYLRAHHAALGPRVARYLGIEGGLVPEILPDEIDEVAHDATALALRRARANAGRFDPARGTATGWVLGGAEYAYVEVAKEIVRARRSDGLVFVDPDDLAGETDANPSTEEHVLRHMTDADALADAATHLTQKEFAAVRLCVTLGFSYAEAATEIFGDESKTKQVDGLLTRGKAKLAAAWQDRRPSPHGAASTNVSDGDDDKEGK